MGTGANNTLSAMLLSLILVGGAFLAPLPFAFADDHDDDKKKMLKDKIKKTQGTAKKIQR